MKTIFNLFLILNTAVSAIALTACVSLKPQTNTSLNNTRFNFVVDTMSCSKKSFKKTIGATGLIRERFINGKPYIPVESMYRLLSFADSNIYFQLDDSIYSINAYSEHSKYLHNHNIKTINSTPTSRIIINSDNTIIITDTITKRITTFNLPKDSDEFFKPQTLLLSKIDTNVIFYCNGESGIYRYNIKSKENTLIAESCPSRNFTHFFLSENENQITAETYKYIYLWGETHTFIYLIDSINTKPIIKKLFRK